MHAFAIVYVCLLVAPAPVEVAGRQGPTSHRQAHMLAAPMIATSAACTDIDGLAGQARGRLSDADARTLTEQMESGLPTMPALATPTLPKVRCMSWAGRLMPPSDPHSAIAGG